MRHPSLAEASKRLGTFYSDVQDFWLECYRKPKQLKDHDDDLRAPSWGERERGSLGNSALDSPLMGLGKQDPPVAYNTPYNIIPYEAL